MHSDADISVPPRFYRIRITASKSVKATWVAMIQDNDSGENLAICDLYCIFSNFDDSGIPQSKGSDRTRREKMRLDGRLSVRFRAKRLEEPQKLVEIMHEAYENNPEIAISKIRP